MSAGPRLVCRGIGFGVGIKFVPTAGYTPEAFIPIPTVKILDFVDVQYVQYDAADIPYTQLDFVDVQYVQIDFIGLP